jgi:hypothetical protein
MWKKLLLLGVLGLISAVLPGSPASAQATRTWVSGVGDDANPCSRTAPCKTFAGAISKTAAGGEIDALDPGGFGSVTITKAITIDGGGGIVASVLVAGTNGINVAAGAGDIVVLRNLRIIGVPSGINGINYSSGLQLSIQNCVITGFTTNAINVSTSANSELYVTDTYITNDANGISFASSAPAGNQLSGYINNTRIFNMTGAGTNGSGVVTSGTGSVYVVMTNSIVASSNFGITVGTGHDVQVDNSSILTNNTGISTSSSGLRITRNLFAGNTANVTLVGSVTASSDSQNRFIRGTTPAFTGTDVILK